MADKVLYRFLRESDGAVLAEKHLSVRAYAVSRGVKIATTAEPPTALKIEDADGFLIMRVAADGSTSGPGESAKKVPA